MSLEKVININGIKGGCGKSSIALTIIIALLDLNKKLRVIELDHTQYGLRALIDRYLHDDYKEKLVISQFRYDEFYKTPFKFLREDNKNYDYIILDGFIFPHSFNKIRLFSELIKLEIYVAPNVKSVNREDLKHNILQYMELFKDRLIIVVDSVIADKVESIRTFNFCADVCAEYNLPKCMYDYIIPHYPRFDDFVNNKDWLTKLLLKIV